MRLFTAALLIALACLLLPGCPRSTGTIVTEPARDYDRPLPPGELALRRITNPDEIPDFTAACASPLGLREAIANSLSYLAKPSSEQAFPYGEITHAQAVAGLIAFQELLDRKLPPAEMNRAIRETFDVYTSVGCDDRGTVLFTGYYTPIFNASPTRTDTFRHPLYRTPANLVKDAQGAGMLKDASGRLTRYPDRRALEANPQMLAGNELAYLADPFEAYIAHVQGSAKLRMPGGELKTVGYAANNGHDYQSVARMLQKEGQIPGDRISLQAMMAYFKAHPGQVGPYTSRNPRYVFFAESAGDPRGCLNEEVTPWRSIATDKTIFPRACLAMIDTTLPRSAGGTVSMLPYKSFMLDQDAGNAIRAAGRCDVYMGVGDKAGELAGRALNEGRLYYLFLKTPAKAHTPMETEK